MRLEGDGLIRTFSKCFPQYLRPDHLHAQEWILAFNTTDTFILHQLINENYAHTYSDHWCHCLCGTRILYTDCYCQVAGMLTSWLSLGPQVHYMFGTHTHTDTRLKVVES